MWGKPKSPKVPPLELVTVLTSPDPGLVAVAKSILQSANIPFLAKGEMVKNLWGIEAVQLQVSSEDAADAVALLTELKETEPS